MQDKPGNIPPVTVLMSVYNGEDTLCEAMDSILAQTFTDFEFLIVNDASTDGTADILETYSKRDSRIRLIHNPTNLRLAAALNKGLREAKAPLVARMDDDDVSLPERLERQVAFMREHPEVSICGTHMSVYDTGESFFGYPLDDAGIRLRMLFSAAVAHASCIYRKQTILEAGGYPEDRLNAEDYALWVKLMFDKNVRFANLPETLYRYRVTPPAVRSGYASMQERQTWAIHADIARRLIPDATQEETDLHAVLTGYGNITDTATLARFRNWLKRLNDAGDRDGLLEPEKFQEFWQKLFFQLFCRSLTPRLFWEVLRGAGADPRDRAWLRRVLFWALRHKLQKKLLPSRLRVKELHRRVPTAN